MAATKLTFLLRSNRINVAFGYVSMVLVFLFRSVATLVTLLIPRWSRFKRKDIAGQKVLITGAGGGLGRHLAVEFSKHATCLLLVDIDWESLVQTKKLVEDRSRAFVYQYDVTDYRKVCEMAEKVKRDVGEVDILVNNAGVVSGKYLQDLPEEKIVKTMEVNVLAHFWTVKAFLPAMMKKNSGHLVSIASLSGKVGFCKMVDYCASKYAAIGFAESLEVELREQGLDGIKVTVVCPSVIDTGFLSGFRLTCGTSLDPEYVAKEVVLGVLEEQELIYLPSFVRFVPIVKECLPRWFGFKLMDVTALTKSMENFTGRQSNEVHKPGKID